MATQLSTLLTTTSTLLTKFQQTLTTTTDNQNATTNIDSDSDSTTTLPLLQTTSTALRAQVTKLSLLSISKPFTPTALTTVLRAVNESILPSLVTASLLVTSDGYTEAFRREVRNRVLNVLVEFGGLVVVVKGVADNAAQRSEAGEKDEAMTDSEKDTVTVAAGRVWEACDVLTSMAERGVIGFVVFKVEQWRDLIKDAVGEIEEWDPQEDDEFFDDLMGDDADSNNEDEDDSDDEDAEDKAQQEERKKSTLRFLKPVLQIYPAIITNRLKKEKVGDKALSSKDGIQKLEKVMEYLGRIPDLVDEVAGALYEDDEVRFSEFLKKVKKDAEGVVTLLSLTWEEGGEDKFTVWSRTWGRVMGEVGKSVLEEKSA